MYFSLFMWFILSYNEVVLYCFVGGCFSSQVNHAPQEALPMAAFFVPLAFPHS